MWCCLHFRSTCNYVSGFGELHMGHVIDEKASLPRIVVSWHSPCIDRVSILGDMCFESQLCFCLSKIYLIAHYLFSRWLSIYLCWGIV